MADPTDSDSTSKLEGIVIPTELLPSDGRFGSGPSKVRPQAVAALAAAADAYLGTSHRQATVKNTVARLRHGLRDFFGLPEGYEVLLGNGGATAFWDAMVFGLIERRSQHFVFGEFSSKCAQAATAAPHLGDPGSSDRNPAPIRNPSLTRTSICTRSRTTRPRPGSPCLFAGRRRRDSPSSTEPRPLQVCVDPHNYDVYYFAPQKGFASDGGMWIALCSPAAVERIQRIAASDRYVPASLDLKVALDNSVKDQTYNTPGLATIFLMLEQLEWMLRNGGLGWSSGRCDRSAEILYGWADSSKVAVPFVMDPAQRSHVVGTIDFGDRVDAAALATVLRSNGIVDTEPYRKLGRNQLRIAMYPAIDPDDIEALTRSIDHVVEALA